MIVLSACETALFTVHLGIDFLSAQLHKSTLVGILLIVPLASSMTSAVT